MNRTEQFQRILTRLLRPIARVMIANGLTFSTAAEALKRALFYAATHAGDAGARPTDSRISLMTGLHRKDVRRLRDDKTRAVKRPMMNACALTIALWTNDADFCNADGSASVLPRIGDKTQKGFDDIIRQAKIDLPASTVLDALAENGAVVLDIEENNVTLVQDVFQGTPNSQAKFFAYEKNLLAHLDAATNNLLTQHARSPHFERAAHFNRLSPESVTLLKREADILADTFLKRLNTKALALQSADIALGAQAGVEPKGRFCVGAYVFVPAVDTKNDEGPSE